MRVRMPVPDPEWAITGPPPATKAQAAMFATPPRPVGFDHEGSPEWHACPNCDAEVNETPTDDDGPTEFWCCTECGWSYAS